MNAGRLTDRCYVTLFGVENPFNQTNEMTYSACMKIETRQTSINILG